MEFSEKATTGKDMLDEGKPVALKKKGLFPNAPPVMQRLFNDLYFIYDTLSYFRSGMTITKWLDK